MVDLRCMATVTVFLSFFLIFFLIPLQSRRRKTGFRKTFNLRSHLMRCAFHSFLLTLLATEPL